jgi:hypothetical protein
VRIFNIATTNGAHPYPTDLSAAGGVLLTTRDGVDHLLYCTGITVILSCYF